MAIHWLLVLCAFTIVGVGAEDLSDFSNNLASDIGPLLVLFGESMTKQYISESTSFLDYFIFAMAPIGIITTIVSTIRVCGHSSLRAFIGRSQEGDGVVEAELCTSTSRDVCELFNRGGITRVLGRPSILELVYTPRHAGPQPQSDDPANDDTELVLSRSYFAKHYKEREDPHWEEFEGSLFDRKISEAPSISSFAPNPNLSLNVGIVKRSRWVFFAVAIVGFILQGGVLALAGAGVWILHWEVSEGGDASSRDYAPIMFITGTSLMCAGMWGCAFLIGQSTKELRFRRRTRYPSQRPRPRRPRLLWLQPGPQVIGDQSFDPFAYFEDKSKDRIQMWMSSQKEFHEKAELYTVLAVLVVLVGYIMQFIGLRGMKAWVSLTQLGITIVMGILRGGLRMQRLDRNANRLAERPDLVSGHELDWLSVQIAGQISSDTRSDVSREYASTWHLTGQHGEVGEVETGGKESTAASPPQTLSQDQSQESSSEATKSQYAVASNNGCDDVLRIRARLAHLTGHISLQDNVHSEHQKWKDGYVKTRSKAGNLSTAITQAAAELFLKPRYKDILLRVQAASLNEEQGTHPQQEISVTLRPPAKSSDAGWRVNSAQLEAILGLWMWTLLSDKHPKPRDNGESPHASPAEGVQRARIVSAGIDDQAWNKKASNIQGEMDLWLGPSAVEFMDGSFTLTKPHRYGLATLWKWDVSVLNWTGPVDTEYSNVHLGRLCGWNLVHRAVGSGTPRATTDPHQDSRLSFRAQFTQLAWNNTSLLDLCAQELFTALAMSLAGLVSIDETTISETDGTVRLENKTVGILVKAFVQNGLGSNSDALLCIIPALRDHLRLPEPEQMLSTVIKVADGYRQTLEWDRAETLLRWLCARFSSSQENLGIFVKALRTTGELYRYSLAHGSTGTFGKAGVQWMRSTFEPQSQSNSEVREVLDCYREIEQKVSQRGSALDSVAIHQHRLQLAQAIRDRNRTETLYNLCYVTAFSSSELRPALPLAVRNDWSEVVRALLETKPNPNNRDEKGRTAMSHCAELGYLDYAKALIDRGATLDPVEKNMRTPLFWAAQNGHDSMFQLFTDTVYLDVDRPDTGGITPLWIAVENGHDKVVRRLLAKGASTEAKNEDGQTPLLVAAQNGHEIVAQLLLENDADPNSIDKRGVTPLLSAAINGHATIVRQLLRRPGIDIEAGRTIYSTPLYWAAAKGHTAIVQQLLEHGAICKLKDGPGDRALLNAASNGWEPIVALLLAGGADIESMNDDSSFRETPLLLAARRGNTAVVRCLVENGANIEAMSSSDSALGLAAQGGHEAIVQLLFENGAELESAGYGESPLCRAAENGHTAIVTWLCERGADIQKADAIYRPLSSAIDRGREAVVQVLLDKGAPVEAKDFHDCTPLVLAADRGHPGIIQMLLDKGADTESTDHNHRTPLILAAKAGHEAAVQVLLKKGANIESMDSSGHTALALAATNLGNPGGHEGVVQLLLDWGADIRSVDDGKSTLLVLAAMNGFAAVLRWLLDKGADIESTDGNNRTLLALAAISGHEAAVQLLLDRGANIESRDDKSCTPLTLAIIHGVGDEENYKFVLTGGIPEMAFDQSDVDAALGVKRRREAMIQLLLDRGANIESKDSSSRTPLSHAADGGLDRIVQQLLDQGANVNSTDDNGHTPLSLARKRRCVSVVHMLEQADTRGASSSSDGEGELIKESE